MTHRAMATFIVSSTTGAMTATAISPQAPAVMLSNSAPSTPQGPAARTMANVTSQVRADGVVAIRQSSHSA